MYGEPDNGKVILTRKGNNMSEKYVVICEYKNDAPLAHETYLEHASYEDAYNRMMHLEKDPRIIRVAIGELIYKTGNKTLLMKE